MTTENENVTETNLDGLKKPELIELAKNLQEKVSQLESVAEVENLELLHGEMTKQSAKIDKLEKENKELAEQLANKGKVSEESQFNAYKAKIPMDCIITDKEFIKHLMLWNMPHKELVKFKNEDFAVIMAQMAPRKYAFRLARER